MRTAFLFALTLLVALATAQMDIVNEISLKVKASFDQETGTFAEGAFDTLLEAYAMIGATLEGDITDENELYGLGVLNCLVTYNLACLEAINGNTEEAFTWLETSIDAGYADADWMREDLDLATLREDARLEELAAAAAENKVEDCSGPCSTGGSCCGSGECN